MSRHMVPEFSQHQWKLNLERWDFIQLFFSSKVSNHELGKKSTPSFLKRWIFLILGPADAWLLLEKGGLEPAMLLKTRPGTPWKTNMSPENQWLEDVFPIELVPF